MNASKAPRFILLCLFTTSLLACTASNPKIGSVYQDFYIAATPKENIDKKQYEAKGSNYMISSQGNASTLAGLKMFELGGNAIDAAAAVSFAISVERPQSTGLGGGGFMLVHFAKTKSTIAVDFRERAPKSAFRDMFLDKNKKVINKLSQNGALSVGVPGLVAGVIETQAKYGKLSLKQIIAPAIELAEKGFVVYPHLARALQMRKDVLAKFPATRKIFFNKEGTPLRVGERLVQKDLAKSLKEIAQNGRRGFYKSWIAKKIVASQKKHGGKIRQIDLDNYEVKMRKPVWGTYRGLKIASMSPPSSGGVHILQILNVLSNDDLANYGPFAPKNIHFTASAMQMAYADRAKYLGDSDFVKVPVQGLVSKKYALKLRKKVHAKMAMPSALLAADNPWPYQNPKESDETTHFNIMDRAGNTVSSTQTINGYMGSGVVAEGTGIVLNNEMDDFSVKPGTSNLFGAIGGKQNAIAPGKRPLSSMSPTIVFKDDVPVMAVGTPSGTRIITCVTQTILNYFTYKMPLYEAVAALRYHHQWSPDQIRVDEPGFSETITAQLRRMGYAVNVKNLGCRINAITREGDSLHGVSDPRGEGRSLGN